MHSVSAGHGNKRPYRSVRPLSSLELQRHHPIRFRDENLCHNCQMIWICFRCVSCSDSDPCLSETAQHKEQNGEQYSGRWAEEDPHGRHHGSPGSAGGEDEQGSGFP